MDTFQCFKVFDSQSGEKSTWATNFHSIVKNKNVNPILNRIISMSNRVD